MKEITPAELRMWKENGNPFHLIDLREEYEVAYCTIGGRHIPMGDIIAHADLISRKDPVVFHCQSGKRSAAVVYALEQKFNFNNLYTLRGGVIAWGDEVDPGLECFK
ncbi:MAG: rhodanese-like domain-containing protein [Flavobacteriales bacterium]|jgi:rhodanese-related sulfurtransferase